MGYHLDLCPANYRSWVPSIHIFQGLGFKNQGILDQKKSNRNTPFPGLSLKKNSTISIYNSGLMALQSRFGFQFSVPVVKEEPPATFKIFALSRNFKNCRFRPAPGCSIRYKSQDVRKLLVCASKSVREVELGDGKEENQGSDSKADVEADSSDRESDDDDDPFMMTNEERAELRKKIRQMIAANPDVEEEQDPEEMRKKMQKLLADYPLVVNEDDPDWPEDADGRGFNLDQFFDKITIKNVKKDDDEDYDSDKEIVWQDDNYIRPINDITSKEWEDTVFTDFNPLIILVHNRYKRPRENEKARVELDKAVQMFWETGMPSPRCVAVDAVVEQDLVSALKVSTFPEIIFTKAGKILHRDKAVRTADEWSKIMAFFYYKAVRPPCLDKTAGQNQEKIPSVMKKSRGYTSPACDSFFSPFILV